MLELNLSRLASRSDLRVEVAGLVDLVSRVSRPLTHEVCRACTMVLSDFSGGRVGLDEILSRRPDFRESELRRLFRCGESFGFVECSDEVFSLVNQQFDTLKPLNSTVDLVGPDPKPLRFSLDRWVLNYERVAKRLFNAENILGAVSSGQPQWTAVFGSEVRTCFDLNKADPSLYMLFNEAMYQANRLESQLFAATVNANKPLDVLDVGGGGGAWLDALSAEHVPLDRVVNYEFSETLPTMASIRRSLGLSTASFEFVPGDFFRCAEKHPGLWGLSPGDQFDLVSLNWILHDWSDDECVQILSKVKSHLKPKGLLLVQEALLPPDRLGPNSFGDIMILLQTGGLERTEEDFRRLFRSCGLMICSVVDVGTRRTALVLQSAN